MVEPTASGVFCNRMLSMVNSEDVNAIIQAQRHMTIKGKIAKQYPEAFSNIHESPIREDDDDDEFDPVPPSAARTITTATSEQSTESCDTSPGVISPTVSRCSEELSQELPDTPTSDVLETGILLDEGPDSVPAE
ncbi:KxDL motif-containing protein 1 [Liparis tanakae]|uniref:KxDL motif-containing protein 1 n=1 Tax=Liparis tanakae TaxID=230148 RepID=A0A4Z2I0S0_9TELE|nr:KxDL motif-containing protein 1 [Liparis tanakae]